MASSNTRPNPTKQTPTQISIPPPTLMALQNIPSYDPTSQHDALPKPIEEFEEVITKIMIAEIANLTIQGYTLGMLQFVNHIIYLLPQL